MPRDACFYDGRCGLCRRTTRFLRAIDLFHRLDFIDMSTVPAAEVPFAVPTSPLAGEVGRQRRPGEGSGAMDDRATGRLSNEAAPASADFAALLPGMPMRTRTGRELIGFPAVRRALAQTPLAPLAWPLYLPGLSHLAAAWYRHIAATRTRDCAIETRATGSAGPGAKSVRLSPAPAQRILRP